MSHLNYNHLYYFWMVCKQGSVTKAAEALFLTPQTVTGQIKALEERMGGAVLTRRGRGIEPTELGRLVFKYADKMFGLSYEMLDSIHYSQHANVLFDVGVADALSKHLVSKILLALVPADNRIHLRCFESTHEMLLEQLAQHQLDVILSDYPVHANQDSGLYSKKLGESTMSFFSMRPLDNEPFPALLEQHKLLIPGRRTAMGRKVLQWFDSQGIQPDILGEFDDLALIESFARYHHDSIFLAPTSYLEENHERCVYHLGEAEDLKEEYYVVFAERMIQHPALKSLFDTDFQHLF